jgi:hypothetical protein
MSLDLGQLLLKALNGLSAEEQGQLLVQLLDRSTAAGGPGIVGPGVGAHGVPVNLDAPLGWAAGLGSTALAEVFATAQVLRAPRRPGAAGEPELKVLPVRLPVADYERLRDFSRTHDFSMAVVVRTLVERFLDGQEQSA